MTAKVGSTALIVLASLVWRIEPVQAQALPNWRIESICAKESAPGQCAAFEHRALETVSSSWSFVLDPIKAACLSRVNSPFDQSWRLLAECIDGETLKALAKIAVKTARTPGEALPATGALTPPSLQITIPPPPELMPPPDRPKAQ